MLVNDNIQKLVKGIYRRCKDDKEFYALLQDKIRRNIDKLFDTSNSIDKKYNAVFDLIYDLNVIKREVDKRYKSPIDREQQLGGYNYRYVQEDIDVKIDSSEIQKVKEWAEKNNWPRLDLGNKIIEGKEAWDNILSIAELNEPYKDVVKDVIMAIRKM